MPTKPATDDIDDTDATVRRNVLEDLDVRPEDAEKVKAGRTVQSADPSEGGE